MHIDFRTGLIVSALLASIVLAIKPGDRLVPAIALVTASIAALIDFRIIQLSSTKLRIDVILPAIMTLTGAICWSRAQAKSGITAATVITIAGLIMVTTALRLLG
ncbi:MAG TPA: hypothetical protein VN253_12745 [Kofleriaceae bacterium]|nr:hypothetical protein [Kofleriaceae bacterium]